MLLLSLLAVLACKSDSNQPPQITSVTATPDSVAVGGSCVLRVVATDADEDSVAYSWQAAAGSLSSESGDSVVWTAPGVDGKYAVSVVASDGKSSDAANASITVGTSARLFVTGYTHYTEAWATIMPGSFVMLLSDPIASTASVSVAGRQLRSYPLPEPRCLSFMDTLMPTPGTRQDLAVQSSLGNCAAACTVPGGFALVTPTSESLPIGTTLVMSWTTPSSASWYQLFIDYGGYDTAYWSKETSFVVTTTNAAVPGVWFSRDGWAYVDIFAGNGPSPDLAASAPGNVTGDARGFWIGLNSIEKSLIVGSGRLATQSAPARDPLRSIRALMAPYQHREP